MSIFDGELARIVWQLHSLPGRRTSMAQRSSHTWTTDALGHLVELARSVGCQPRLELRPADPVGPPPRTIIPTPVADKNGPPITMTTTRTGFTSTNARCWA
jgi:hypothetical protein